MLIYSGYSLTILHCPYCRNTCSTEVDTCPKCGRNLRNAMGCPTCLSEFIYTGQIRCEKCGATLPDLREKRPQIEFILPKVHLTTFVSVENEHALWLDRVPLPKNHRLVQRAYNDFDIPGDENVYLVNFTSSRSGYALAETGIYGQDKDDYIRKITYTDMIEEYEPIKASFTYSQITICGYTFYHKKIDKEDFNDEFYSGLIELVDLLKENWDRSDPYEYKKREKKKAAQQKQQQEMNRIAADERSKGYRGIKTYVKEIYPETKPTGPSITYNQGNALQIGNKRKEFGIPENAEVYMLVNGSHMDDNSKGFALTSRGIYYPSGKNAYRINWKTFVNCDIKTYSDVTGIKIGEFSQYLQGNEPSSLYDFFKILQFYVSIFTSEIDAEEKKYLQDDERRRKEAAERLRKETEAIAARGFNGIGEIVEREIGKHNVSGYGCKQNGGKPLVGKDADKARVAFAVPGKENIYFMASTKLFGGFKENCDGFALCDNGLYYRRSKQNGIINWREFAVGKISLTDYAQQIYITGNTFNIVQCEDIEVMKNFLNGVKKWIIIFSAAIFGERIDDPGFTGIHSVSVAKKEQSPTPAAASRPVVSQPAAIPKTAPVAAQVAAETKFCINCGKENPLKAKFCKACGQAMPEGQKDIFCVNCGNKTKYGKKFCPACGAKIEY